MKILLEKKGANHFYKGEGQWTVNGDQAKVFANVLEATNTCEKRGLADVHIHMAFDNPAFDVFLPIPARDD